MLELFFKNHIDPNWTQNTFKVEPCPGVLAHFPTATSHIAQTFETTVFLLVLCLVIQEMLGVRSHSLGVHEVL